ncbi:MAG: CocE/NonD family hydrolase [Alphaproteobacteria bacterium]|nr:CocE/NonD family hydrolase [Alphaproteobacteria bacterium]
MAKAASARRETVSRPRYRMKTEPDVYVAMRDGVRISCCIWRPDAEGEFPTLYAASPYQWEYDDVPAYTLFPWRETGPIEWYVQRGYAYVHADVRGAGRSEGEFRFLSRDEQLDNVEMIGWIAKQPWSDGKVGGIGQSYFAFSQWLMGVNRPKNLTCIAPYDALCDPYRDHGFHGGIYCQYRTNWYIGVRRNALHRPANARPNKRMEYDLGLALTEHDTYDDWWKERTAFHRLGEIDIPVLNIGHWAKQGLHLRGNLIAHEYLKTKQKKLVVTGFKTAAAVHHAFDTIEFHEEFLLPFYDRYLKGMENGYEDLPPVRVYVNGAEAWREEKGWPLKRAKYVSWYLKKGPSRSVTSLNDGGLSTALPPRNGGRTGYSYPDGQWANGVVAMGPKGPDPVRRVLTFTSDPLEEDVEAVGPVVLELYASSTNIDTDFIVKLAEQRPQSDEDRKAGINPPFTNISKGWLKASHHTTKNEALSTPYRPFYDHDHARALTPGAIYKFEIEILPVGHRFKAGNRIRVEIVNGDSQMTDRGWTHPYHPSKVGSDTFEHNERYPSRLLLPVISTGKRG